MNGIDVGSLSVISNKEVVWKTSENKGDTWHTVQLSIFVQKEKLKYIYIILYLYPIYNPFRIIVIKENKCFDKSNKYLINYSFQISVLLPLLKEFFLISLLTQFRHLSANVIFIKASNRKLACLAYSTSNLFANTKL